MQSNAIVLVITIVVTYATAKKSAIVPEGKPCFSICDNTDWDSDDLLIKLVLTDKSTQCPFMVDCSHVSATFTSAKMHDCFSHGLMSRIRCDFSVDGSMLHGLEVHPNSFTFLISRSVKKNGRIIIVTEDVGALDSLREGGDTGCACEKQRSLPFSGRRMMERRYRRGGGSVPDGMPNPAVEGQVQSKKETAGTEKEADKKVLQDGTQGQSDERIDPKQAEISGREIPQEANKKSKDAMQTIEILKEYNKKSKEAHSTESPQRQSKKETQDFTTQAERDENEDSESVKIPKTVQNIKEEKQSPGKTEEVQTLPQGKVKDRDEGQTKDFIPHRTPQPKSVTRPTPAGDVSLKQEAQIPEVSSEKSKKPRRRPTTPSPKVTYHDSMEGIMQEAPEMKTSVVTVPETEVRSEDPRHSSLTTESSRKPRKTQKNKVYTMLEDSEQSTVSGSHKTNGGGKHKVITPAPEMLDEEESFVEDALKEGTKKHPKSKSSKESTLKESKHSSSISHGSQQNKERPHEIIVKVIPPAPKISVGEDSSMEDSQDVREKTKTPKAKSHEQQQPEKSNYFSGSSISPKHKGRPHEKVVKVVPPAPKISVGEDSFMEDTQDVREKINTPKAKSHEQQQPEKSNYFSGSSVSPKHKGRPHEKVVKVIPHAPKISVGEDSSMEDSQDVREKTKTPKAKSHEQQQPEKSNYFSGSSISPKHKGRPHEKVVKVVPPAPKISVGEDSSMEDTQDVREKTKTPKAKSHEQQQPEKSNYFSGSSISPKHKGRPHEKVVKVIPPAPKVSFKEDANAEDHLKVGGNSPASTEKIKNKRPKQSFSNTEEFKHSSGSPSHGYPKNEGKPVKAVNPTSESTVKDDSFDIFPVQSSTTAEKAKKPRNPPKVVHLPDVQQSPMQETFEDFFGNLPKPSKVPPEDTYPGPQKSHKNPKPEPETFFFDDPLGDILEEPNIEWIPLEPEDDYISPFETIKCLQLMQRSRNKKNSRMREAAWKSVCSPLSEDGSFAFAFADDSQRSNSNKHPRQTYKIKITN